MKEHALRVLIVDDEEGVRIPLAERLHHVYNYQVDVAEDGNEALRLISEVHGRYDVTLIDQVLEGEISGLELLRQIKARYPEIQAIVFTGWGMEKEGVNVLRQGAYRYFAKPFNLEELALTIQFAAEQRLLRREREYLSELVQVSHELTQTTDLERQLELVWNFVQERLATATFFIALYDSVSDTLRFPLSFDDGEPDPLPDRHLGNDPANWGVAGYVVKNKQEQTWFSHEQADQEWQTLGIMPHISGEGPSETGICLPLRVGGKILGALSVQSYQSQAFDQAFLDAVSTLVSHLAPAIENARLFQEIIQRTSEVETTRDHLERLVASSFDGIVTIDTSGIVTGFNAMAEQILGYEEKEVLSKSVSNLYYDPEEPRRIGEHLRQSTDGKLTDYETSVKNKRGDRIPIHLSATWLFDAEGNQIGSVGYFRDLRHIQETEMHRQRLLEASNAIAKATDLEEGLQSLSRIMVESCIATFCSILLLSSDDKSLVVKAACPFPRSEWLMWEPGIGKACTPFQEPSAAKILMSDETIILREGRRGAKVLKHLGEEIKLSEALRSVLIVPLQADKRRLGVCILGEMRAWDRSPITDRKIELARSLANQAATFIEKMRLHELTRQRAESLEALQDLSLTVSASLNLDEILEKTCQAAVELFGVDHSGLVLFDSDHVKGKVAAEYPVETNTMGIEIPLQSIPLEEKLIEGKEPVIIFDIEKEGELGRVREIMYGQFDIHSTVYVPVISKGEILGSFSLDAIGQNRQFSQEEIGLCKVFAAHVASAIENARLHQETEQRSQLLEALEEASRHIRAEKEPTKLLQEVVRLAAELMGCQASGLFINHSYLRELELITAHGLPEDILSHQISHEDGLIGGVAKTGEPRVVHDYSNWGDREAVFEPFEFSTVAGIPLKHAGDVVAVLFVADSTGMRHCNQGDLDILKRFTAQASIALHASQLMGKEQRRFSQLAILHRISNYIQEARNLDKILHVVLTGVTAGYGLGFNRAALLLLDGGGKNLIGCMGIGQLSETEAWADWESHRRHGLEDFGRYIEALEQNTLTQTPIDKRIQGLLLTVEPDLPDIFSQTVLDRNRKLVKQEDIDNLPSDFRVAFEPALPLVVVPIIARERALGVLVADNKFTQAPITPEDVELLLTFTNTAGLAIDNVKLYQEAGAARDKIRTLFEASNALVLSQASKQVLEDVIDQTQLASGASWVSIVLVDEMGQARNLFTTGTDNEINISNVIRPDGITMWVMLNGEAAVIEDTHLQRQRVNPRMFRNKVGAALCLPFSVQGKQIGVMWIHYDEPRHFNKYETEAIQLFVNQAAIAYDSARRMEELEHMRKAAEAMAGVLEPSRVLQQIVESASEVLQADSSAIWSYDNVRNQFIPEELVAYGIPKFELERFRKKEPTKGGTANTVMKQGWIGVTDISDPQYGFMGPSTMKLLKSIGAKSFQGIALQVGEEELGVLYANYNRPRSFTDEDRRTLETFAYHAALALKKARLLEQVGKARDAAKVVAQVSVLEELRYTLDAIVKGTQEALDCDVVTLYTYNQERDEFGFPPTIVGVEDEPEVLRLGRVADRSVIRNILALEKAHEAEDAPSDSIMQGPFVFREQIKSSVGIPLRVGDRTVGVMFVNFRIPHRFTDNESTNIELFANQAAVAIRNGQLFEGYTKRLHEQDALVELSKVLLGTTTLQDALDQAVVVAANVLHTDFCDIVLFDSEDELIMRAGVGWKKELVGNFKLRGGSESQSSYTVMKRHPIIVDDYKSEKRFKVPSIVYEYGVRSGMSVPIYQSDRVIGAMLVHTKKPHIFDEAEINLLSLIANQMSIAIQSAEHRMNLQNAQEQLAAQSALDWMRIAGSTWSHGVTTAAIVIKENAQVLRKFFVQESLPKKMGEKLQLMEEQAQEILNMRITVPLSAEVGIEFVGINAFLRERIPRICAQYEKNIKIDWHLELQDTVVMKVCPEWFKRAIDILVDNAVEAMFESPLRTLTISNKVNGKNIEIFISDTGKGIPKEKRIKLFREPLPSDRGMGTGLMLAAKIIRTYQGSIHLGSSNPTGTTMIISIPKYP